MGGGDYMPSFSRRLRKRRANALCRRSCLASAASRTRRAAARLSIFFHSRSRAAARCSSHCKTRSSSSLSESIHRVHPLWRGWKQLSVPVLACSGRGVSRSGTAMVCGTLACAASAARQVLICACIVSLDIWTIKRRYMYHYGVMEIGVAGWMVWLRVEKGRGSGRGRVEFYTDLMTGKSSPVLKSRATVISHKHSNSASGSILRACRARSGELGTARPDPEDTSGSILRGHHMCVPSVFGGRWLTGRGGGGTYRVPVPELGGSESASTY